LLQVGSGSVEKITGSRWPKITGSDRILIPGYNVLLFPFPSVTALRDHFAKYIPKKFDLQTLKMGHSKIKLLSYEHYSWTYIIYIHIMLN